MEPGGSVSLYIVEDNPGARIAIRSIVERAGFGIVVGEAADGLTAVEQVLKLKPAIVLMDIVLPRLDGIEAASQIKTALPQTKVIILSQYDDTEKVEKAVAAGIDGYCLKSAPEDELRNAIRTVANGGAWLHAKIARRVIESCQRHLRPGGVEPEQQLKRFIQKAKEQAAT